MKKTKRKKKPSDAEIVAKWRDDTSRLRRKLRRDWKRDFVELSEKWIRALDDSERTERFMRERIRQLEDICMAVATGKTQAELLPIMSRREDSPRVFESELLAAVAARPFVLKS